jgi:hypothetical protein
VSRAALERLRVLVRGRAAAFAAVAVVLAAASGFLELA